MKLLEIFESGKFAVTSEVGPPKGVDIEVMLEDAELLRGKVDAINVTDQQSSVMRLGSLTTAYIVQQKGLEAIYQCVCRDRNRIALQSDLLSAWVLGIKNVLSITGDLPQLGDHPEAKAVYDLDSVTLLQAIKGLNEGHDMNGNELKGKPDFFAGAVVTPEADPIEPQMIKFEKKIAAGAKFIQTQAIYDLDNFKRFMERARRQDVKIMAGIVLLVSAGMARYMNKNVPGIFVPDELIKEMADAPKEKRLDAGIRIAGRMIRQLREEKVCDGVHIMAIGKEEVVPDILAAAGL